MIFDKQALFSDAQAITEAAASTNIIDNGAPGTPKHAKAPITQDLGKGRPIEIAIQAVEDFKAVGPGKLTVTLEVADNEGFSTNKETAATTGVIDKSDLVAGKKLLMAYLPEGVNRRFMRLNYTVGSGPMTAGKVTAGLVFGHQNWAA